jgi:AcrR family transcriptional regulator
MASRRNPSDYFAEGLEVLEAEGFPALTAAGLCERMGVTRGSFYHHFTSFDDFVDGLLRYWEERYTSDRFATVEAIEEPDAQREEQLQLAESLPHQAEAAIRVWSTINERVAAAQRRVDEQRRSSVAELMRRGGLAADDAIVYADLAVSSLAGMQLLDRPVDVARLRRVLAEIQAQTARKSLQRQGTDGPHRA